MTRALSLKFRAKPWLFAATILVLCLAIPAAVRAQSTPLAEVAASCASPHAASAPIAVDARPYPLMMELEVGDVSQSARYFGDARFEWGFVLRSAAPEFRSFIVLSGPDDFLGTDCGGAIRYTIAWGAGGHPHELQDFRASPWSAEERTKALSAAYPPDDRTPLIAGHRFTAASKNGLRVWIGLWSSTGPRPDTLLVAFTDDSHPYRVLGVLPGRQALISTLSDPEGMSVQIDLLSEPNPDGTVGLEQFSLPSRLLERLGPP